MAIYDDLDEDKLEHAVERCGRDFAKTKNPLHAWEAWGVISLSRRSRLYESVDVPAWLAAYFDACAEALITSQSPTEGRHAVARAIGFRDGLSKARERWGGQYDARERLAERVFDVMWDRGIALDRAQRETPGASESSAKRAARGASRWAIRKVQDRVRSATGGIPERTKLLSAYSAVCRKRLTKSPER